MFWLKYENKCEMKQGNQREVILCIYLQYISCLVYHSYANIIALLIILESYLCNYYLYMIYVNKFFRKSKETKNKRMEVFLPLCITLPQSFTITNSYYKNIAFLQCFWKHMSLLTHEIEPITKICYWNNVVHRLIWRRAYRFLL